MYKCQLTTNNTVPSIHHSEGVRHDAKSFEDYFRMILEKNKNGKLKKSLSGDYIFSRGNIFLGSKTACDRLKAVK